MRSTGTSRQFKCVPRGSKRIVVVIFYIGECIGGSGDRAVPTQCLLFHSLPTMSRTI